MGAAWLPWWAVLGLSLAVLLTVREGQRLLRVPLMLLGVGIGLLVLLPGLRGAAGAETFTRLFVTVFGGMALVAFSVSALEGRRTAQGLAGLGTLLLLGTVLPGAALAFPLGLPLGLGLLALVLTLLGAPGYEERPTQRLPGRRATLEVAGLGLLGAALLGVLALAWPGSAPPAPTPPPAATGGSARPPAEVRPDEPAPPEAGTRPPSPARPRPNPGSEQTLPGGDLPLLGGLFLILALWFMLSRARRDPGEKPRLTDLVVLASILVAALVTVVFIAATPPGRLVGEEPQAEAQLRRDAPTDAATGEEKATPSPSPSARLLWALSLLAFLTLTLLAAGVLWMTLRSREARAVEEAPADPALPGGQPAALHRVRVAYRDALAALGGVGLGRGEAETPAEHAARVAAQRSALAAPLRVLVAAYAPVRYGGRVTDEDAAAAETAAGEVARAAQPLGAQQAGAQTRLWEGETP